MADRTKQDFFAQNMRKAIRLLTLRERDILERLASGRRYKEIAGALGVNVSTIAVHVRNAYKKLEIHSRKELAVNLEEMALGARNSMTECPVPSSDQPCFIKTVGPSGRARRFFKSGSSPEWLRDGLGLVRKTSDIEALAATVKSNGGVYIVPAFSGLGAPYWNRHARGTLVGLTCDSNAGHQCRAVFEGIACQTNEVLKMMASDAGLSVSSFRADGRMTENNLLMQFQSDILGLPISRSRVGESMALGAAYCAGLAVGYWPGQQEIDRQWVADKRFEPHQNGPGPFSHASRPRLWAFKVRVRVLERWVKSPTVSDDRTDSVPVGECRVRVRPASCRVRPSWRKGPLLCGSRRHLRCQQRPLVR